MRRVRVSDRAIGCRSVNLASHYTKATHSKKPIAKPPPNLSPHCHSQVRSHSGSILSQTSTPFRKESPKESSKERRRLVGIYALFRPVVVVCPSAGRRREAAPFPRRRACRCLSSSFVLAVAVGSCARQRAARCVCCCCWCSLCRPV